MVLFCIQGCQGNQHNRSLWKDPFLRSIYRNAFQRHISWICDLSLGCLGRNWAYHSLLHQHPTAGLWISILTFLILLSFSEMFQFFFIFLFFSFERSCHKWINWERHRRISRIAVENNSKSSVNVWPRTVSSLLYFTCLYRSFCTTRIARHPVFDIRDFECARQTSRIGEIAYDNTLLLSRNLSYSFCFLSFSLFLSALRFLPAPYSLSPRV